MLPDAGLPDQPETCSLGSLCRQCNALQQEFDNANGSLEVYKMKEAVFLVDAGKYNEAATMCERLVKIRQLEIDRKWTTGDKDGADDAEKEALTIKYELAMVLKKQGKLPEAEVAKDSVWKRRKVLLPKNHNDTNMVQRHLCLILRAQCSKPKYKRAGKLHDDVWSDPDLELGDGWVMENGHELGMVFIEQGSFLKAEDQLGEVLEANRNSLGKRNQATVETAAQLAALMAERGRAKESAELLRPFLVSGAAMFSLRALECAATVCEELFELGEYPSTERVCRVVWNDAKTKGGCQTSRRNICWLASELIPVSPTSRSQIRRSPNYPQRTSTIAARGSLRPNTNSQNQDSAVLGFPQSEGLSASS